MDACRKAASGQLPVQAVAENFRRFLKKHNMLADVEEVSSHLRQANDRTVSGVQLVRAHVCAGSRPPALVG